uniref:Uncharacterized protein n=1 Tax=Meloidogyne javanica TaxID=6303 RepID=A0A915MXN8_MELJA
YVAPSLPTAECQSATPNECNILPQPSINPQPAWSSGAGGTYAQKNNEGDRELLQQNKGEGYSGSDGSSGGFGQKTNFENSFPMDLYGEDELALADYDEEFDTKTFTSTIKTTLKTTSKPLETTSKKLFAVVPPEKATTTFLDDKDDVCF